MRRGRIPLQAGLALLILVFLARTGLGQSTVSGSGSWSGSAKLSAENAIQPPPPPVGNDGNRYENPDGSWIGARYDAKAELPRVGYYTAVSATPSNGTVRTVASGSYSSLVSTIAAAQCGDVIVIPAKNGSAQAVYAGDRIIPTQVCDSSHYITVRTDQISNLPAEGARITPAWAGVTSLPGRPAYDQPATAGVFLPKLVANVPGHVMFDMGSAAYFRFIGIEITVDCTQTSANYFQVMKLGGASAGHHILDRVWLHGCELPNAPAVTGAPLQVQAGVSVNGRSLAIIDSYLNDFYTSNVGSSTDSQAVLGGSGDDPQGVIKITNNFLESATECGMFGGGAATVNPTDIEIRRNHCFKPLQWRCDTGAGCPAASHVIVKNAAIELKNGVRVLFEGNVHENVWNATTASGAQQGDQKGFAILITPKNQSGLCPICIVTDVTYRYGKTKHTSNGFQMSSALSDSGAISMGIARITLHDYVMDDISTTWAGGDTTQQMASGIQMGANSATPAAGQAPDVTIAHNTIIVSGGQRYGGFLWSVFDPANPIDIRRLTIQDNIAPAPMWYLNPNSSTYNGVLTYLNVVNGSQDWCVQGNLISTGNWTNQQVNNPWPAPGDNPSAGSCHNGASNNLVGAYSTLGFMNWNSGSGGDYRLSASSVYKGAASDGKDPGADIDKVEQYIGGSASTQEPPAAPNVSFTPTSLTFGAHVVGTSSSAQTVTLQNVGSGTLNITSITASGDFHETTGCVSSLAANASCTMSVTFTPTLAGTRTGAIAIADDAPGSPHTIALSGTGLAGAGGAVTIYPATDSIPQGTKLPLMCDPGPCTYSFVGTPFGTLASNGNYTAPGSNGTATIRATSGANHADAVVTVSGTLPAMLGDCAGGGSYPHSGTTLNQCSYNHVEIGGTAQRFFDVMIPTRYVSGQSGLIVNVGLTTHRISNWCDGTQAGNETTGWGAYLNTVPSPAPVYICMEGSLILGGAHPEAWNWWGQATASWSYCAGATPCNPDEGLAARSIIQAVVRDLNLNPRKVFIVNDWNDSPAMQIGVQNADLVAGVGVWADMFFNNADASKVVQGGPNDGFSIPYPAVPISYVNLASAFNYNTQPSLNAICTSNSGTHPLNTDDIWDYLATANGITNPSCGVTGSAYQSCSAATDQNFCTGTYNTNGVGQTTSLEAKAGVGKAGSGVLILKMAGNTSHNLPYTELGWNGEDFTVSGGPAALDMSNSACNSPTPCNRFGNTILGNTGRYGVMSSRYKWFFGVDGVSGGHGKP